MRINAKGLELVKSFEGLKLESYFCPAGLLSIGYGSTGPHVKAGMKITELEAEKLLEKDLRRFELGVSLLIGDAPTTSDQYSALVAFAFNVGLGNLKASTLLKKHKAGDIAGAAAQFSAWVKARNPKTKRLQVLPGLVRRRAAEAKLYRGEY